MKIMFVANRSELFGGGQISLVELVSRLDRDKFVPLVLCPGEGSLTDELREKGIEVLIWDMPAARTFNLVKTLNKFIELRGIIEGAGVDVVHSNGSRAQFYSSQSIRGTKAKLVWHVRVAFKDIPLYDKFLYSGSNRVICASRGIAEARFKNAAHKEKKLRIIYNAVDLSKFSRDEEAGSDFKRSIGVTDDNTIIGAAGVIMRNKGYDTLIDAFKDIVECNPGSILVIAGDTPDKKYFQEIRRNVEGKGLGDRVIFTGRIDNMPAFFSALDMFVMPSLSEGFSRVLVEAMASALPVIATDIPGNNEAIVEGESGMLFAKEDMKGLSLAIEVLLKDRGKAKELGRAARVRAENEFCIEKHVGEVQKVYEELRGKVQGARDK